MKPIIMMILLVLPFFYSCSEIGLTESTNDIAYISFVRDMTKDTTVVSFKTYTEDVIRIPLQVKLNGRYSTDTPVEFTLSANLEKTTLPADKYAFDDKYVFSPGQETDTVYIELTNYPDLQDTTLQLCVQVDESDLVKRGDLDFQNAIVKVSDRLIRPTWWIVWDGLNYWGEPWFNIAEEHYLGAYSEKKYLMFLEELAKDDVQFDGSDRMVLRVYALRLKYRVKEYNDAHPGQPMWDEENNEEMTIPVAG